MAYDTIRVENKGKTAVLRLNRPEVRNAFDAAMVREVRQAFESFQTDAGVRCVVVTGEGGSFCSGVDLRWLGAGQDLPREEHEAQTLEISRMFRSIYDLDKPVLAAVEGAALGGGVGFLAVADIVIASSSAVFGLSEVRIGVVPACIAPYLLLRSPQRAMLKSLFISGVRFGAEEARAAGLLDLIAEPGRALPDALAKAASLMDAAPLAQGVCKQLFRTLPGMSLDEAMRHTARVLAEIKTGNEAKKGIEAFLNKRKLDWA
ncbi:MAG: enoyl-CoA hydratase-related protein [Elusimicrobiota bacterium]